MSTSFRPRRPSLLGEARRVLVVAAPALAVGIIATVLFPDASGFLGRFWGVGLAAGILLNAIGIAFWAFAAVGIIRAWKAGELATGGAYGLVRHPIFAWWIWFVLPGTALIQNSWPLLVVAIVFFVAALPAARAEEKALAARFGEAYEGYRDQVRMLVPIPRIFPLRWRKVRRWIAYGFVAAIAVVLGFALVVRPVMLGYGTTREERGGSFAGDRYLSTVRSGYTQAYVIDAPPETVWGWLVQVGYGRGGWYNIDAINRLASPEYFYEENASARRIIPELQQLDVGDVIYIVPQLGQKVVELVPNSRLLLVGDEKNAQAEMNASWLFELEPIIGGPDGEIVGTRLISRFRSTFPGGLGARVLNGFVNEIGGAIIQQPAMFAGIARRAEKPLTTVE